MAVENRTSGFCPDAAGRNRFPNGHPENSLICTRNAVAGAFPVTTAVASSFVHAVELADPL